MKKRARSNDTTLYEHMAHNTYALYSMRTLVYMRAHPTVACRIVAVRRIRWVHKRYTLACVHYNWGCAAPLMLNFAVDARVVPKCKLIRFDQQTKKKRIRFVFDEKLQNLNQLIFNANCRVPLFDGCRSAGQLLSRDSEPVWVRKSDNLAQFEFNLYNTNKEF